MIVYIKLVATAFFWGGTFIAGRDLAPWFSPYTAAFFRFLVASVALVFVVRHREGRLPLVSGKQWFAVTLLGLSGIFTYNIFFFTGLQTVAAGRAAVIIALNPISIAVFSALFLGEPLTRNKIMGILLSVCGATAVISQGDLTSLVHGGISSGDLAIFGCVASWTTYSLIGKVSMKRLTPHGSVTWSCLLGTAMLLPVAVTQSGFFSSVAAAPMHVWFDIIYLGFFGTVLGFTWFYEGVKAIGASKAAVFINIVPVTALILGVLMLNERIGTSLVVGGILVLTGVYLTNRPTRSPSLSVGGVISSSGKRT
ncbi:DMT family transporter [Desulfovibrio inopinatus]|uniref:DMT family transporter n=1 Tax=Desulfovibrio inopinatus TaxID=102109 RepID=UPI000414C2C6|nr:DMT family transporter [Desulfovibrio inopinatus]